MLVNWTSGNYVTSRIKPSKESHAALEPWAGHPWSILSTFEYFTLRKQTA